ncbi:hypothetical protein BYT27DRAFT_6549000 [Phlegmacium glaucopus]|nr:hypothetical protein BYT27DRAFT_6549000 [Phlegmacium glaucopus]
MKRRGVTSSSTWNLFVMRYAHLNHAFISPDYRSSRTRPSESIRSLWSTHHRQSNTSQCSVLPAKLTICDSNSSLLLLLRLLWPLSSPLLTRPLLTRPLLPSPLLPSPLLLSGLADARPDNSTSARAPSYPLHPLLPPPSVLWASLRALFLVLSVLLTPQSPSLAEATHCLYTTRLLHRQLLWWRYFPQLQPG